MTAKEIYDWLENLLTSPNRDAADYPLVIRTSEPHLSGQGIVPIKWLSNGFDWYKGKILVTPDKELVPKNRQRDNPLKPIMSDLLSKGVKKPFCPNCQEPIKKDYKYCPLCGQKLDWSKDDALSE